MALLFGFSTVLLAGGIAYGLAATAAFLTTPVTDNIPLSAHTG
jgi:hypothetical protein